MNWFIDLLYKVPASFWGVVVGSFFSILAVWLTSRDSTARLLKQFENERLVKNHDRELGMKKEIYLDAAEAISAAISTIASLSNLDIPNNEVIERYSSKSAAIAKAHVVGTAETIELLLEFTGEYSAQILKLFAVRHKLLAVRSQIAMQDARINAFQNEINSVLEKMKQFNQNVEVNQQKWEALIRNADFEQTRLDDAIQNRQKVEEQLNAQHREFIVGCSSASLGLSSRVAPLLSAVRKELELPLNLEGYKRSADASIAKQRNNINQYLGNFTDDVKSDASKNTKD